MSSKHDHYYRRASGVCRCGKKKADHREGAGRPVIAESVEKESPPELVSADPERGHEEFIVNSPEPAAEEAEDSGPVYLCGHCDESVNDSDRFCPGCMRELQWA